VSGPPLCSAHRVVEGMAGPGETFKESIATLALRPWAVRLTANYLLSKQMVFSTVKTDSVKNWDLSV
jgi:hypothetical protein